MAAQRTDAFLPREAISIQLYRFQNYYLKFSYTLLVILISLSEESRIFQDFSIVVQKKRDLSNNSNDGETSKKPREGSLNTSTSSDIPDDLFTESLNDPDCVAILLNCIKKNGKANNTNIPQHQ